MNLNWLKKLFASDEKEFEEEYNEQQYSVNSTMKKTPFRFPLISDEEKNEAVYGYPKEEKIVEVYKEEPMEEPVYKPLYTQNIWKQREQPTVIHRAEKKIVEEKKVVVDTPVLNRKKRAFTPTEVPSPIYGFSKTVIDNRARDNEVLEERSSEVLYNQELTTQEPTTQEPEVIAEEELVLVTETELEGIL